MPFAKLQIRPLVAVLALISSISTTVQTWSIEHQVHPLGWCLSGACVLVGRIKLGWQPRQGWQLFGWQPKAMAGATCNSRSSYFKANKISSAFFYSVTLDGLIRTPVLLNKNLILWSFVWIKSGRFRCPSVFFWTPIVAFLQESVILSDDENGLGVSDLGQLSDSLEMHFWRSMMLRYCPSEPT